MISGQNNLDKKIILFISFSFLFLNFLSFINLGLYWDDWWLVGLEVNNRNIMFAQAGAFWYGPAQTFLLSFKHYIWVYRVLFILLSYFICITSFSFFKKLFKSNSHYAAIATLFMLSLPFNEPRILLICFSYTLNLAIFFLALTLFLNGELKLIKRITCLLLFFYSFVIGSLFFLYMFFLLFIFINELDSTKWSLRNFVQALKKYLDFLGLPLVYLFVKYKVLPKAHGAYAGYNSVNIRPEVFYDLPHVFLNSVKNIFSSHSLILALVLTILIAAMIIFKKIKIEITHTARTKLILQLIFYSLILFVLAVIPYLLVGRTAETFGYEWRARDEMLLPFSFSVLITTLLILLHYLLIKIKVKKSSQIIFITTAFLFLSFSALTLKNQMYFLRDMIKQDVLLEFYKNSDEMKRMHTFYFVDQIPDYNIFKRGFGNSELNGMAKHVFKTEDRYFSLINDATNVCPEKLKISILCKDWIRGPIEAQIIVSASEIRLDGKKTFELALLKIIDHNEYLMRASKYFNIQLEEVLKK